MVRLIMGGLAGSGKDTPWGKTLERAWKMISDEISKEGYTV
jgi:hypothetical protein